MISLAFSSSIGAALPLGGSRIFPIPKTESFTS